MKKLSILFIALAMVAASCGDKKKDDADQIIVGKRLFGEKTCSTCHALDTKIIGPSIKDMVKIYDEKGGNLVEFLKGNADAIVDTDPGQVAIMKANLDGFVKDMTPEELQALSAYMRDTAK